MQHTPMLTKEHRNRLMGSLRDRAKRASTNPKLEQQDNRDSGAQQLGSRDKQCGDVRGTAGLTQQALLVTGCQSLYDAILKEGAAPSSTDNRLAIQLGIVKSRAMEGQADLIWIDARCQIADCLTKHASRTFEEVLQ